MDMLLKCLGTFSLVKDRIAKDKKNKWRLIRHPEEESVVFNTAMRHFKSCTLCGLIGRWVDIYRLSNSRARECFNVEGNNYKCKFHNDCSYESKYPEMVLHARDVIFNWSGEKPNWEEIARSAHRLIPCD